VARAYQKHDRHSRITSPSADGGYAVQFATIVEQAARVPCAVLDMHCLSVRNRLRAQPVDATPFILMDRGLKSKVFLQLGALDPL